MNRFSIIILSLLEWLAGSMQIPGVSSSPSPSPGKGSSASTDVPGAGRSESRRGRSGFLFGMIILGAVACAVALALWMFNHLATGLPGAR